MYEKQNFTDGSVLAAEQLNRMETGIAEAHDALPQKLTRPATAQVGDYLRIKAIGADGTMEVEAVPAPTGGATVPTKVSEFENDAGYTTEAQVQELLAEFPTFKIEVVQELPAAGAEKTIYLVPFADDSGSYLEYLYVNGAWEVVGSGKNSGENPADLTGVQTILRNVMTIIRAQVEDASGTPQAYSMDISGLAAECDTLIAGLAGSGGGETPDEPELPEQPEQPVKTLTGISATYSGGSVPVGTAVSALTGVAVTAHYSDGTSEAVSGYTLSGEIADGENTVTVSYQGKTTTITVAGVAQSSGLPQYEYAVTGDYGLDDAGKTYPSSQYDCTDFMDIDPNYSTLSVATYMDAASDARISSSTYVQWFNGDTFLSRTGGSPVIEIGKTNCTKPLTHNMPEGATKFRVSVQNNCDRFVLYKGTVSASDI